MAIWEPSQEALAVVGHPIEHSLSPVMHNAALRELAATDARFKGWCYYRFDISPLELDRALEYFYSKNFKGLNLTIPHKVLALHSLVRMDDGARRIGAVNTLVRGADGWVGYNTDAYGISMGIKQSLGLSLENSDVLLIGCGGAARAAAVECIRQSASSVTVVNRTWSKLEAFIDEFRPYAQIYGVRLRGLSLSEFPEKLPPSCIVINATSLGLQPEDPAAIDLTLVRAPRAVFDMVYNPSETALLRQANKLEVPHANGASMLLYQGVRALELWTGGDVPVNAMHDALANALQQ